MCAIPARTPSSRGRPRAAVTSSTAVSISAEFGWLGAPFSEQDGGYGGGAVETAVVMDGIGRGLVIEPYLANVVLAGGLIARLGTPAQKQRLLAPMIQGKLKLALAFTEAQS